MADTVPDRAGVVGGTGLADSFCLLGAPACQADDWCREGYPCIATSHVRAAQVARASSTAANSLSR